MPGANVASPGMVTSPNVFGSRRSQPSAVSAKIVSTHRSPPQSGPSSRRRSASSARASVPIATSAR